MPAKQRGGIQEEALLDVIKEGCGVELATSPGTVTRPRADLRSGLEWTVKDLSWASDMASDHLPIESSFSHHPGLNNTRKWTHIDFVTIRKYDKRSKSINFVLDY
jgi:hypothetical protein